MCFITSEIAEPQTLESWYLWLKLEYAQTDNNFLTKLLITKVWAPH